jgi:hypothetical protein
LTQNSLSELARLTGAALIALGRAASLQHFTFKESTGRELHLHTEAPWRLTDSSGIVGGRTDYWRPAASDTSEEALEAGAIGATLRDTRNEALRERIAIENPVVASAAADRFGGLVMEFTDGLRLEIFPDASPAAHDRWEYWRLFERGESHYVMGSDGDEVHA